MDVVYYKCRKCGFTYQVPEYWTSYSPDEEYEMPHVDLQSEDKSFCSETTLYLVHE